MAREQQQQLADAARGVHAGRQGGGHAGAPRGACGHAQAGHQRRYQDALSASDLMGSLPAGCELG